MSQPAVRGTATSLNFRGESWPLFEQLPERLSRESGFCTASRVFIWLWLKKRYQTGTLVSGNMDQNLRNPSCLILSHTHIMDPQKWLVDINL